VGDLFVITLLDFSRISYWSWSACKCDKYRKNLHIVYGWLDGAL